MKAFKTMFLTEMKLNIRDMNNLLFGVGFAVALTIILGIVGGNKPAFAGADYSFMAQSFGALVSIGIAATGMMGLPIAVADYRHNKILKQFRVTPVSPALLLLVQFVVNFCMAILSLVMVYATSALLFGYRMQGSVFWFMLAYLLVLLSIYSIGMLIASIAPNMQTVNLLCCVVYFPMLLLSGATLPYEIMPAMMQKAADFLPLTQGIKLLKGSSLGTPLDNILLPVIVMIVLAIICIWLSVRFFRWE